MAGPEASAPSPQVALLVPVQGPKPVVEAEQTGLRDYGTEGGRVTRPRALGTRGGTLPGRPRAAVGGQKLAGRDARRGPGDRAVGAAGGVTTPSRGGTEPPGQPPSSSPLSTRRPAGLEDTWLPGSTWQPDSPRTWTAGREPQIPAPAIQDAPWSRPRSGPPASPGPSPARRSQPVSRRMLSPSGMRAAWEPREPMAAPAEPPGPACSPPAPGRGRPSGPRAEGRGPGAEPGSGTPACLASHPRPRRTENNDQGGGVRGAARTTGRFIPRWGW